MTFWEHGDLMENTVGESSHSQAQYSRTAPDGKHTLNFKIQPLPPIETLIHVSIGFASAFETVAVIYEATNFSKQTLSRAKKLLGQELNTRK